jgi:hypothetical protein
MNLLYRILDLFFDPDAPTVEKPAVTTESIRAKLERLNIERVDSNTQMANKISGIKELLEIFPVGIPASATEIASCYDSWDFSMLAQGVLEELVRTDDSGWEYVRVDGCQLYQKTGP